MTTQEERETVVDKNEVQEQYLKITFSDTGDDKTGAPKNHKIECKGLTQQQFMFAAISIFESMIMEFQRKDYSLTDFIGNLIRNGQKTNTPDVNVIEIDGSKDKKSLEELINLLKAAAKKDKKDE